jgi:PfaD family protein
MADDLTAEADSGGHTDNRPSLVLLPLILMLRDRIAAETGVWVRVGAAGGLAVPSALSAAFAAGADYVMTGTVNQACVESGNSTLAKQMLADAGMADVDMAPASDMFEAGVKVQVLKRGTMFSRRGESLYDVYRQHPSWDAVPATEKTKIEAQILRRPYADVWRDCEAFFAVRDPRQLERAREDRKHEMALVFRWYLGMSSRWAIGGEEGRKLDMQVWCGPAIGAFNEWTRGTFLAEPAERRAVVVAANLLAGAAAITRARNLLSQGVDPGPAALVWVPRRLA